MLEWFMPISNIVEKVNLVLPCEQSSPDTMDRSIAPPLIVKATFFVEEVKEFRVCFAPPEVEIADLKVTPEVTTIICFAAVIGEEGHGVVW